MFDKKQFAYLLNKAIGDRSLNEYARVTGVSAAHISRLTRCLLNTPPTPQTIKKLADSAENNITYNDLMFEAGYLKMEEHDAPTKKSTNESEIVAAYRNDDPLSDLPEEALKEIEDFKKYIIHKYNSNKEQT